MPGPAVYHTLVVKGSDSGFFSNVNRVVNHLYHSLGRDGCRAIRVDWRIDHLQQQFAFGTPEDGNLWDAFFAPLDFPDAPPDERIAWEYADYAMTGRHAYRMYKSGNSWRWAYHRVFRNHIRIHPRITDRVSAIESEMTGRFRVGVHYRHPAHSHECPRPNPPVQHVVARAMRLMSKHRPGAIYLATDVAEAVDEFRSVLGEHLVVQSDVERGSLADNVQVHHNQERPRVALGDQVLTDALVLSRCNVLLHLTSNIATAAGYINPRLPMVYCESVRARLAAKARFRTHRDAGSTAPRPSG